jgi:hypothetical protein
MPASFALTVGTFLLIAVGGAGDGPQPVSLTAALYLMGILLPLTLMIWAVWLVVAWATLLIVRPPGSTPPHSN